MTTDDDACTIARMTIETVRDWLQVRYSVRLDGVPRGEILRRASAILGVSTGTEAGDLTVVSLRLDAEREYERDERGQFASSGAARDASDKANQASGADGVRFGGAGHQAAARAHSKAEDIHRAEGNAAAADAHRSAASAHSEAQRVAARRALGPSAARSNLRSLETRSSEARAHSREALRAASATAPTPPPSSPAPEARSPGTGVGAAANHAEIARGHAERARAAAAGTTPAARASARKAEEHAALAKVAAEFGDHAKAAQHAGEAERHAVAAQMKATVGRPSGKTTLPVQNKSMAEIVAARPRAETPAPSAQEQAKATEMRRQMAEADRKIQPPGVVRGAPVPDPSKAATQPIPRTTSDDHLAKTIQKAVDEAPGRHGFGPEKVFIHRVHEATVGQHGLTLDQFKSRVNDLSQQGKLSLARADLVGAMNQHDVAASQTKRSGAETHFILRSAPIQRDQEHQSPSDPAKFNEWRTAKFDHSGAEIKAPPTAADKPSSGRPFSAKVGDSVSVGAWRSTVHGVVRHSDGTKTYQTGSGDFHESHLAKHN